MHQQVSHPHNWLRVDGYNLETNYHAVRAKRNAAESRVIMYHAERKESRSAPFKALGAYPSADEAKAACVADWHTLPFNNRTPGNELL